jgi:predicted RNA-binding protein with PUA domain
VLGPRFNDILAAPQKAETIRQMYLYNFTPDGNRVFKINIGQSDEIVSSEEAFFRMFYDIEALVWNYDLVLHGVVLVTNYESRRVLSILTWLDCGI